MQKGVFRFLTIAVATALLVTGLTSCCLPTADIGDLFGGGDALEQTEVKTDFDQNMLEYMTMEEFENVAAMYNQFGDDISIGSGVLHRSLH